MKVGGIDIDPMEASVARFAWEDRWLLWLYWCWWQPILLPIGTVYQNGKKDSIRPVQKLEFRWVAKRASEVTEGFSSCSVNAHESYNS